MYERHSIYNIGDKSEIYLPLLYHNLGKTIEVVSRLSGFVGKLVWFDSLGLILEKDALNTEHFKFIDSITIYALEEKDSKSKSPETVFEGMVEQ